MFSIEKLTVAERELALKYFQDRDYFNLKKVIIKSKAYPTCGNCIFDLYDVCKKLKKHDRQS